MLEEAVKIYYEYKGVRNPNIYTNSLYDNLQNDDQIHANVFIITLDPDSKTNVITVKLLSHLLMDMTAITYVCIVSDHPILLENSISDAQAYKKFKDYMMESNSKLKAYTINRLVSYQLGGNGNRPMRHVINSLMKQPTNNRKIKLLSEEFLHKIIDNVKYLYFDVISTAELAELVDEYNDSL